MSTSFNVPCGHERAGSRKKGKKGFYASREKKERKDGATRTVLYIPAIYSVFVWISPPVLVVIYPEIKLQRKVGKAV